MDIKRTIIRHPQVSIWKFKIRCGDSPQIHYSKLCNNFQSSIYSIVVSMLNPVCSLCQIQYSEKDAFKVYKYYYFIHLGGFIHISYQLGVYYLDSYFRNLMIKFGQMWNEGAFCPLVGLRMTIYGKPIR